MFEKIAHRFGQIAVWLGLCREEHVVAALKEQEYGSSTRRLGEILEDSQVISSDDVQCILDVQKYRMDKRLMKWRPFSARARYIGGKKVVYLTGVIDTNTDQIVKQQIAQALMECRGFPIISLQRIDYVSGDGISMFSELAALTPYVLCEVPPDVDCLIKQLGLSEVIRTAAMVDDALAMTHDSEVYVSHINEWMDYTPTEQTAPMETEPVVKLTIDAMEENEFTRLKLKGIADSESIIKAQKDIQNAVKNASEQVLLDVRELEKLSNSGTGFFRMIQDRDVVILASEQHRDILNMVGLTEFYPVCTDETAAVDALTLPYILSSRNNKLHKRECRFAKTIKPGNRIYLSNDMVRVETAIKCSTCFD